MKVLVTGAGGFLGERLVATLAGLRNAVSFPFWSERWTVRAAIRRPLSAYPVLSRTLAREPSSERSRVELFHGDLASVETAKRACEGCDVVIHTAGLAGVTGAAQQYYQANVETTQNLLAASRTFGIKYFVYTSSPSVVCDGRDLAGVNEDYPYPKHYLCSYSETKALAERLVRAAEGVRTCALRPHLIWGPNDPHLVPKLIARARQGKLRPIGDGTNRMDVTYIDNAVQAHLLAVRSLLESRVESGRVWFISQGEPVNCWDFIDRLLTAVGVDSIRQRRPIAWPVAWGYGLCCEFLRTVSDHLPFRRGKNDRAMTGNMGVQTQRREEPPMTRFLAIQLAKSHYYDISRAKRELGYVPFVSVEEGIRRLVQSYVKHGMMDANATSAANLR